MEECKSIFRITTWVRIWSFESHIQLTFSCTYVQEFACTLVTLESECYMTSNGTSATQLSSVFFANGVVYLFRFAFTAREEVHKWTIYQLICILGEAKLLEMELSSNPSCFIFFRPFGDSYKFLKLKHDGHWKLDHLLKIMWKLKGILLTILYVV